MKCGGVTLIIFKEEEPWKIGITFSHCVSHFSRLCKQACGWKCKWLVYSFNVSVIAFFNSFIYLWLHSHRNQRESQSPYLGTTRDFTSHAICDSHYSCYLGKGQSRERNWLCYQIECQHLRHRTENPSARKSKTTRVQNISKPRNF